MGGLAIIWHSRTGAAHSMGAAAHAGAGEGTPLIAAADITVAQMLEAGAYLFVCPENLGTMSGMMKEMFDRTYYPLLGRIEGRAYATAIAAGSDGSGAERQIDRIAAGWRLRRVAEPVIVNVDVQSPDRILARKQVAAPDLTRCRDLGMALAEGARMGLF